MRFIKRLIFILLLLVVAFFIYRLISPTWAQQLLSDLKTFSNDTIGTHFSVDSVSISTTWSVLDLTGVVTTGVVITGMEQTWALQEIIGDEELMFESSLLQDNTTGMIASWTTVSWTTVVFVPEAETPTRTIPSTTTKPTTSYKGLSSQDKRDMENILQGFWN
jgi:monoamine oxidase